MQLLASWLDSLRLLLPPHGRLFLGAYFLSYWSYLPWFVVGHILMGHVPYSWDIAYGIMWPLNSVLDAYLPAYSLSDSVQTGCLLVMSQLIRVVLRPIRSFYFFFLLD